jgi:hypothetical protein
MYRSGLEEKVAQPTPRRTHFTWQTQFMRRVAVTLWVVISLFLMRSTIADAKQARSLATRGKVIYAPMTRHEKGEKNCFTHYEVYVEKNCLSADETTPALTCPHNAQSSMPILYLPDQPTVYCTGAVNCSSVPLHPTLWILGGIFGMAFLAFLVGLVEYAYHEQRDLWQNGELVTATITRHEEIKVAQDTNITNYIVYQFTTKSGKSVVMERKVRLFCHWRAGCHWHTGTTIPILYNPKHPQQNRPVAWCRAATLTP